MENSEVFDKYFKEYDEWYEENKLAYLSEVAALKKVIPKGKRGWKLALVPADLPKP
jgi:hypothetical protein